MDRSPPGLSGPPVSRKPGGADDLQVRGARIIGPKHGRAGDEQVRPRLGDRGGGLGVDAAIDLERHPVRQHRSEALELADRCGNQLLVTPAGVDAHAEHHVERVLGDLGERLNRGRRADDRGGAAAALPDEVERPLEMGGRLDVDGDAVGARPRKLLDALLRPLDHQVDVDHPARVMHLVGDRADRDRPERDRRDEVAIHDVHVNDPGAGGEHLGDVGAEPGEIGGEDRGRHPALVE